MGLWNVCAMCIRLFFVYSTSIACSCSCDVTYMSSFHISNKQTPGEKRKVKLKGLQKIKCVSTYICVVGRKEKERTEQSKTRKDIKKQDIFSNKRRWSEGGWMSLHVTYQYSYINDNKPPFFFFEFIHSISFVIARLLYI